MKTALVLVDIQNDYFPGGANALWKTPEAAEKARAALELFRRKERKDWPIVHIRHINTRAGATFFLPDTVGSEIHESVRPNPGEEVIIKHFPDSFLETTLREYLETLDAKRLVICGMMSHMCIDTTVRSAKGLGYDIVLMHDACTTRDLAWGGETLSGEAVHKAFMASLAGAFAKAVAADELETALA